MLMLLEISIKINHVILKTLVLVASEELKLKVVPTEALMANGNHLIEDRFILRPHF